MCEGFDPGCWIEVASDTVALGPFGVAAKLIQMALGEVMLSVASWWIDVPTITGGSWTASVEFVQTSTRWLVLVLVIFSLLVGGIKIAWSGRGEPAKEILQSLLTMVVVSGGGVVVATLLVTASDEFASWLVGGALGWEVKGDFFTNVLFSSLVAAGPGLGIILIIIMGFIAAALGVIQLLLMMVRSVMLLLMTGILPLGASFSSTEMGRAWLKKLLAWFFAFLAYKPAAALVYAVAVKLMGDPAWKQDPLISTLMGITVMLSALVAMPALIKFMAPMTEAIGGGGSAAGGMSAMGALAMGAKQVFSAGGGDSSSAGGSRSESPNGATTVPSGGGSTPPKADAASGSGVSAGGSSAAAGTGAGASGGGAASAGAGAGPVGMAIGAGLEVAGAAAGAVSEGIQSGIAETDGSPAGSKEVQE